MVCCSWGLCYRNFYGSHKYCNVVVTGSHFHLCLIFERRAEAYHSGAQQSETKYKTLIITNLFTPKAATSVTFCSTKWTQSWFCWTSKSNLSNKTKCDQILYLLSQIFTNNHKYLLSQIWSHLKLQLTLAFVQQNRLELGLLRWD